MRRRPKLNAIIAGSFAENRIMLMLEGKDRSTEELADALAHALVEDLDRAGYIIIEKKTRRRERDSLWRRESEIVNAQDEERSVRAWALRIADDLRHLEVRCSFLYHAAIDHGATPDELAHETQLEKL